MAPIIYPTVDELIETNRRALIEIRSKKADSHRVLSRPLLIASLEKVKAESGDLYDKAAVLLTELVRVVERECNPTVYPFLTLHSLNR